MTANRANRAAIAPMGFSAMEGKPEIDGGANRAPSYFLKAWGAIGLIEKRCDRTDLSPAIAPRNPRLIRAIEMRILQRMDHEASNE